MATRRLSPPTSGADERLDAVLEVLDEIVVELRAMRTGEPVEMELTEPARPTPAKKATRARR